MVTTDKDLKTDLISVVENAAKECIAKAENPHRAGIYRDRSKELTRLAKALKKASTKGDAFQRYVEVAIEAKSKGVLPTLYAWIEKSLVIRGGNHSDPQAFLYRIAKSSKRIIAGAVRLKRER